MQARKQETNHGPPDRSRYFQNRGAISSWGKLPPDNRASPGAGSTLMNRACYDLAHNPPTYDAVSFIVQVAERFGTEPVHIGIAPGPVDGFRDDNLWPRGRDARVALLMNIVVPLFEMLPNATISADHDHSGFGANEYIIPWRHFVRCMGKGIRPLRPPAMERHGNLVTITLRESEHWPQRNSDLPEWLAAAEAIEAAGYQVVFIRDTLYSHDPLPGFQSSATASLDLSARSILYRSAACNMFVSNGPAWLAMACDALALVIKPNCEELGRPYNTAWFAECGIEPGGQYPNAPPYHRFAWQPDTRDAIVSAFDDFMRSQ
jgi:hypothetical protein